MTVPLPRARLGASWLLRLRCGLALLVLGFAVVMRFQVHPCDAFGWVILVLFPVLLVQGVTTLVSLVRAVVALVRRDHRAARVEGLMVLSMLATVPAAVAINYAVSPTCIEDESFGR